MIRPSSIDTEMVDVPLTGERRYSMRVEMAGHPPEEVYGIVGKQMVDMLEHVVALGWKVVGQPVVTEEYDFLQDKSVMTAVVTLKDSMLEIGQFR